LNGARSGGGQYSVCSKGLLPVDVFVSIWRMIKKMERHLFKWYFDQVIKTLRYDGLPSLFWRITKVCLSPLGSLGLRNLYQKDLGLPLKNIQTKGELTITQATQSDIEQLAVLVARRYSPAKDLEWYSHLGIRHTILERFEQGQRCFVGKIGKEIVHYNWIFFHTQESVPGTGRFIHLRDNEALMDDAYTSEGWRGKAIHTAVHNQMLWFLKQAGYRKVYTGAGAANKSSQKTHHRLGWELCGTMLIFIPRGAKQAWVWPIRGTTNRFMEHEVSIQAS